MIGQTILHYNILEKLGQGGMGVVYKAHDTKLDRIVALKFLPSHLTTSDTDKARFLQEAKAAAALNHNNVCTIYDIQEFTDPAGEAQQFIVMEYVEGVTLRQKLAVTASDQTFPLSIDSVIDYAIQIAEALEEAHSNGIIHRDIKSDNIMVNAKDQVKVMDFGLAKLKGSLKITRSSSTIGTVAYMAPEHLQGTEIDARSDIFSFGVLLYEMLSGKLPFKGEYESAVMYAILNQEPEPVDKYRPDLSAEWLHILNRSLEKNPDNRYQSMSDLLIDLRRLKRDSDRVDRDALASVPVKQKKTALKGLFPSKIWLPTIITVTLLVVIVLLILQPWHNRQIPLKTQERSLAVMYFENNTGDATLDHWEKALSDLLIADLLQSKYIQVLSGDRLFHILKELNLLDDTRYSSEDLKEVGQQAAVRYILRGNLSRAGDVFRINTILQTAETSEPIASETVEGHGEKSMFSMVDELTRRIRSSFQLTSSELQSDLDLPVGTITTGSPEAYKYYSEGREYHDQGQFERSIELMEKAIALDPEFAMAYRSIAVAYDNMGYKAESKKFIEKALQYSDRISDRERYRIRGFYFRQSEVTYPQAIAAYEKLLALYPQDQFASNLGGIYSETEQFDKAKIIFQRCIDNGDDRFYAFFWMAVIWHAEGKYEQAQDLLQHYIAEIGDHGVIRFMLVMNHVINHRWDQALSEIDKCRAVMGHDFFFVDMRGFIQARQGHYQQADSTYRRLLQSENLIDRLNGQLSLADLALSRGRFRESLRYLDQGITVLENSGEEDTAFGLYLHRIYLLLKMGKTERAIKECDLEINRAKSLGNITRRINALLLKGMAHLAENDLQSSLRTQEQMKQLIDGFINPKEIRNYHLLAGLIAMNKNKVQEAIFNFEQAVQSLPFQSFMFDFQARYYYPLAQAYYQSGDMLKARIFFEKVTQLTSGAWNYGDIYALSYYMLGRIDQERGLPETAKAYYETFLRIWQDADEGLPQKSDAQKRLAMLKQEKPL
jgi:serine/threonine protein kinase/predicted Zn-dependent protease